MSAFVWHRALEKELCQRGMVGNIMNIGRHGSHIGLIWEMLVKPAHRCFIATVPNLVKGTASVLKLPCSARHRANVKVVVATTLSDVSFVHTFYCKRIHFFNWQLYLTVGGPTGHN